MRSDYDPFAGESRIEFGKGAETNIRRFELTAALVPGQNTTAKFIDWNGTDWVAASTPLTFTVYEMTGKQGGEQGQKGWAIYRPSRGWEVLWIGNQRWLKVQNDNAGTAPAYAILRPTGVGLINGEMVVTVDQPNTTLARYYLVNSAATIASGATGPATLDFPTLAAFDSSSGTPAYGDGWGPKPSSWKLNKAYPGFTAMGYNLGTTATLALGHEIGRLLGKTDSTHNKSASGTVSIYIGTLGSETDSTMNVTAYNAFANVGSGKWVWIEWQNNGWYLTAAEC